MTVRPACCLALALLAAPTRSPAMSTRPRAAPLVVGGWLTAPWDFEGGLGSFRSNADLVSQVSPVWWRTAPDGGALPRLGRGATGVTPGPSEPILRAACYAAHAKLLPLISNASPGKGFDPDLVHALIADPARRTGHVRALATIVRAHGYDGLEIDYEEIQGADREDFSRFIAELADALHADGHELAIAVHPKTEEPGGDWGPSSQDWAALGRAVDWFRIMTYDHHWSDGPAGAIGPLPWFRKVLAFAVTQVPPGKIQMGLPAYGYDWTGSRTGRSEDVTAREAPALARRVGARIRWDRAANEPHFRYRKGAERHEVWYEDARSLDEKLAAVRAAGVAGVAIWRLGAEADDFWDELGEATCRP